MVSIDTLSRTGAYYDELRVVPDWKGSLMDDAVVVFYRPGCPFGIRLRTSLTLHRVRYTSVRFRDDEAGAAHVREVNNGNEISPTVHVKGRWLTNPSWQDVVRASSQMSPVTSPASSDS